MARAGVRVQRLLGLGAALGLALATADLLTVGDAVAPASGIATVNGTAIRAEDYERALAAFASDRRSPVDPADRRHVLDRLIDEELLVQRGLELGLAERDRRVRADIVSGMIEAITAEARTTEPTRAEVEAFYAANRAYFARAGRIRARQILVRASATRPDSEARERALEATRRLRAGEDFARVRGDLGDPEVAPLPDVALPAAKLREYLGPSPAEALLRLAPGEVSGPIRSTTGYLVLESLERTDTDARPLPEVESEVRAELRRRRGDAALRAYLEELRRTGDVRVREVPP
jgi:parvulin-like peptidyl-prolyl isomerase